GRERSNEPTKNLGRVVPIRKAVEHPHRALSSPVTGVGTIGRERNGFEVSQFARRGLNEQSDFPMAGVITEGNWFSIGRATAALGTEDEELFAAQFTRIPAHAGVLGPAENIAAGRFGQHLRRQRQAALRARTFSYNVENVRRGGRQEFF